MPKESFKSKSSKRIGSSILGFLATSAFGLGFTWLKYNTEIGHFIKGANTAENTEYLVWVLASVPIGIALGNLFYSASSRGRREQEKIETIRSLRLSDAPKLIKIGEDGYTRLTADLRTNADTGFQQDLCLRLREELYCASQKSRYIKIDLNGKRIDSSAFAVLLDFLGENTDVRIELSDSVKQKDDMLEPFRKRILASRLPQLEKYQKILKNQIEIKGEPAQENRLDFMIYPSMVATYFRNLSKPY